MTNPNKGLDFIVHDFLIAKPEGFSFSYEVLNVMKTHPSDRI